MELKPFIATHVNPGQPLTAQAWNDVIDAIDSVHKFVAASAHTVRVRITNQGLAPALVRITAVREGGAPVDAVLPVPPDDHHILAGLEPGAYTVRAEAPSFAPATATVTVGDAPLQDIELALQAAGTFMPDLFGMQLAQARAQLAQLSIVLARLLDFTGQDLPPQNPGPDLDQTPVLVQSPAAGTVLATGASAQLVVAVPVRAETTIEVPSLAGLTQVEARKALEALGLVVGKTTNLIK
jgi:hypothetical protein